MRLGICGLNCEECNDFTQNNCEGCTVNCESQCEIRKCAQDKNYLTCLECIEFVKCKQINNFFDRNPHAKNNFYKEEIRKKSKAKKVEHSLKDSTFSTYVLAGNFLYTSHIGGICDNQGNRLLSIEEQTEQCFKYLKSLLNKEGLTLNDVVKTTVYLKSLTDFRKMRDVYRGYFADGYPARMTATTDFIEPDCLIMIEAVAYKPDIIYL